MSELRRTINDMQWMRYSCQLLEKRGTLPGCCNTGKDSVAERTNCTPAQLLQANTVSGSTKSGTSNIGNQTYADTLSGSLVVTFPTCFSSRFYAADVDNRNCKSAGVGRA